MSTAIIITVARCRFCPRQLAASLVATGMFGNESAGYTCPDCVVKLHFGYDRLAREWSAQSTVEIDMPIDATPSPCIICGRVDAEFHRSVWVEGDQRVSYVCATQRAGEHPCERKWAVRNREKLGPVAQYGLKLR